MKHQPNGASRMKLGAVDPRKAGRPDAASLAVLNGDKRRARRKPYHLADSPRPDGVPVGGSSGFCASLPKAKLLAATSCLFSCSLQKGLKHLLSPLAVLRRPGKPQFHHVLDREPVDLRHASSFEFLEDCGLHWLQIREPEKLPCLGRRAINVHGDLHGTHSDTKPGGSPWSRPSSAIASRVASMFFFRQQRFGYLSAQSR